MQMNHTSGPGSFVSVRVVVVSGFTVLFVGSVVWL